MCNWQSVIYSVHTIHINLHTTANYCHFHFNSHFYDRLSYFFTLIENKQLYVQLMLYRNKPE